MRMNHMPLNRKWILFSLALLSPAILAAENLNFNYTRADALSMDSRLGLQARACHSKGDPMNISIRFTKGMNITKLKNIDLEINGSAYTKSYAVFSPSIKGRTGLDTDFQIPWSVSAKGDVTIKETRGISIPAVPEHNDHPFCFSNGGPKYYSILYPPAYTFDRLLPIFRDSPYYSDPLGRLTKADFEDKCQRAYDAAVAHNLKDDIRFYWPYGSDSGPHLLKKYNEIGQSTGSYYIEDGIIKSGNRFLFAETSLNVFFASRIPYQPPRTEYSQMSLDYSLDESCTTSNCKFTFPTGKGNYGNFIQDGGEFSVKLNNRNVSSLMLSLTSYDNRIYTFKWQRNNSEKLGNILYLSQGPGVGVLPIDIDTTDPYKNFYVKGFLNFYRGTLVSENSLKMDDYKYYINNFTPLSLPANKMGDINLVNTDSITFTLGNPNNGVPTLGVFGQPMKFAPLLVNDKETASAMQIRNACY
ncbi:hypothetical protein IOM74_004314 [Salmonella enterica]|nr:hypothetical protein [Salmonella enterica]